MTDWKALAQKIDEKAVKRRSVSDAQIVRESTLSDRATKVLSLLHDECSSIVSEFNGHVVEPAAKLSISEISIGGFLVSKTGYSLRISIDGNTRIDVRIAKDTDFTPGSNSYLLSENGEITLSDSHRARTPTELADSTCERFINVGTM